MWLRPFCCIDNNNNNYNNNNYNYIHNKYIFSNLSQLYYSYILIKEIFSYNKLYFLERLNVFPHFKDNLKYSLH